MTTKCDRDWQDDVSILDLQYQAMNASQAKFDKRSCLDAVTYSTCIQYQSVVSIFGLVAPIVAKLRYLDATQMLRGSCIHG